MSDGVPYLRNSGDLGAFLFRLMSDIEKIDKIAQGVQLLPCDCDATVNNTDTLDDTPPARAHASSLTDELYASLTGVLAACGRVDAMRLVQEFRPSPELRS